jgi:hypothetical protein
MSQSAPHLGGPATAATGAYNPVINPEDFVPEINKKYFTLKPGTR